MTRPEDPHKPPDGTDTEPITGEHSVPPADEQGRAGSTTGPESAAEDPPASTGGSEAEIPPQPLPEPAPELPSEEESEKPSLGLIEGGGEEADALGDQPKLPPQNGQEEPPNEQGAAGGDWRAAWYRAVIRGKEVENENARDTGKANVEGMQTTRHERYFFMGLSAFGAVASVALAAVGIATSSPDFYLASAGSSAITGGSSWRLILLSRPTRGKRGKRGRRGKKGKRK